MNKRLILLILCLPIILMISLFSVSNVVSISISVPVSNVKVMGDSVVYLNFDASEKYKVDYTVYPTNAKNKQVYFNTEKVGNSHLAELEFIDGQIIAKSCGKAKVYITTVDGGFRDSFIVQVDSINLQSIDCSIESNSIYVGDTTKINTIFNPEDTNYKILYYRVADKYKNIVSVNANGVVTGLSKGYAKIIVTSDKNDSIYDTVELEVKNKDIIDLHKTDIVTWQNKGSINISLDTEENCTYSYVALDENGEEISTNVIIFEFDLTNEKEGRIALNYEYEDTLFKDDVFITISATTESGLTISKNCKLSRVDQITAILLNSNIRALDLGAEIIEPILVNPADAEVDVQAYSSNDNIIVEIINNIPRLTAKKVGVSTLTVKVYNKENHDEFVELTKEIVVTTSNLIIEQSAKTYGIENVLAFARTEVGGALSEYNLNYTGAEIGNDFTEYVTWVSSSNKANIDKTGKITLGDYSGTELVEFKAVFEYKGITFKTNTFNINCVYDGVNVRCYNDLWNATNVTDQKPIVLHNDIKEDFGTNYKEILSTYDTTFYKDNLDKAKIKILIEFKNNVYGNGYTINAHNVAWSRNLQNATTNAIFKGPCNFVAMTNSSQEGGAISVKAQDNVCFAVYEGVTLTNINLKGCDLQADTNNQYDLTDLDYTGTTVEVFGDNVNIQYSRITNGRTVLRAFGDIEDSSKSIHLNIKNSVLSGAREFVLRLGTNCFVEGTSENPSPNLPNDEINSFPMQKEYSSMSAEEKLAYDNSFIKTFVNVKNSVFKDAGIFAIALDSHFAGAALEDGSSFLNGLVSNWKDLAKTSYGVKLTFEDEVKMYCWKDVNTINSDSLIEVKDFINSAIDIESIKFDVQDMIKAIANNEKFANIIYTDQEIGTQYVHAGIAFFGGGKNYSVFEDSNYVTHDFNGYEIKLSDVGKSIFQAAAGNESFYFMLNDSTTQNFLPQDQENLLNPENPNDIDKAYSCIFTK